MKLMKKSKILLVALVAAIICVFSSGLFASDVLWFDLQLDQELGSKAIISDTLESQNKTFTADGCKGNVYTLTVPKGTKNVYYVYPSGVIIPDRPEIYNWSKDGDLGKSIGGRSINGGPVVTTIPVITDEDHAYAIFKWNTDDVIFIYFKDFL